MARAPVYFANRPAPQSRGIAIAPVNPAAGDLGRGEILAPAVAQFGEAVGAFALQLQRSQEETRALQAQTDYGEQMFALTSEAERDPDFQTTSARFTEAAEKVEADTITAARLTGANEAKLRAALKQNTLTARKHIQTAALRKETDANVANFEKLELQNLNMAATAPRGSAERVAIIRNMEAAGSDQVRGGWIQADVVENRRQAWMEYLDQADVVGLIRDQPKAAVAALKDPDQFLFLAPAERQRLIGTAEVQSDKAATDKLMVNAAKNPYSLGATHGRVLGRGDGDKIYELGMVPRAGGSAVSESMGFFMSQGWTREQAAGIVGNLMAESNLNPVGPRGDQGTAAHIAQWRGDRLVNFNRFMASNNLDPTNRLNQLKFVQWELENTESGAGAKLRAAGTPAEAAAIVDRYYERSSGAHRGKRIANANRIVGGAVAAPGDFLSADRARAMATELGMSEVTNLPASVFNERLAADPQLAYTIGKTYFNQQLTAFDGSIPAALAGFTAGSEAARRWYDAAKEKFGEDFTPEQFASVVDDKAAAGYVREVYGRIGVTTAGVGVSANGRDAAMLATLNMAAANDREERQAIVNTATLYRAQGNDPEDIVKMQAMNTPDNVALIQANTQAAAMGSAEATAWMKRYEGAQRAYPHTEAAWRMDTAQLDGLIAQLDSERQAGGIAFNNDKQTQLEAFSAVRTERGAMAEENPYGAWLRGGGAPVFFDPAGRADDPNFVNSLAGRDQTAQLSQARFNGASAKPFTPGEATAMGERWNQAVRPERLQMLGAFAAAMSRDGYEAAIDQIGLKDYERTAAMLALYPIGNTAAVMEKVMVGAGMLKDKDVAQAAAPVRQAIVAALGGDLYPTSEEMTEVADAATAIMVAEAGGNITKLDEPKDDVLRAAVEQITGEIIDDHHGMPTPAWPDATSWKAAVDNLSDEQLAAAGGAISKSGQLVPVSEIRDYGQWKPITIGSSRYAVGMVVNGAFVPYRHQVTVPGTAEKGIGGALIIDIADLEPAASFTPQRRGRKLPSAPPPRIELLGRRVAPPVRIMTPYGRTPP